MVKTLKSFEIKAQSGGIANNLELIDLIYVRYKNTNSKGIILCTSERNIFHNQYYKGEVPVQFTYLPLLDRNSNQYRKRMNVTKDSRDFEVIPAFDISFLNKKWVETTWTEETVKEFNTNMFNKY